MLRSHQGALECCVRAWEHLQPHSCRRHAMSSGTPTFSKTSRVPRGRFSASCLRRRSKRNATWRRRCRPNQQLHGGLATGRGSNGARRGYARVPAGLTSGPGHVKRRTLRLHGQQKPGVGHGGAGFVLRAGVPATAGRMESPGSRSAVARRPAPTPGALAFALKRVRSTARRWR
jgi:hypothetical protein